MRVSQHIYIVTLRVHIVSSGESIGFHSETSHAVISTKECHLLGGQTTGVFRQAGRNA